MLMVVGVIGILAASSIPSLMSHWRARTLTAGAQDLRVILNSARQVAIRENTDVCVEHGGPRVRLRVGGCSGPVWTGPRTDGQGWFTLVNNVEVATANANVTFSFLGAASPAGTYMVRRLPSPQQTLTVTVAASGRITIP
jgi:Tfp pilus assembly protein FimT